MRVSDFIRNSPAAAAVGDGESIGVTRFRRTVQLSRTFDGHANVIPSAVNVSTVKSTCFRTKYEEVKEG